MKSLAIALGLVCLVVSTACGAPADDFAALLKLSGADYRAAREKLVAAPPAQDFLNTKFRSGTWEERLLATIVIGWRDNAAAYRNLLAAPRVADQKGTKRYQWAVEGETIREADLPLMYEMLTKDPGQGDEWDPALAIVRLAEHAQVAIDMRLLHDFFQQAQFTSTTQHVATAWLLGNLPTGYQSAKESLLLESLKAEVKRPNPLEEAVSPLLIGLARAAQDLNNKRRDELVQEVQKLNRLQTVLGATLLTHAIGNIGGDLAGKLVAAHLEASQDEIEKQWALASLSRSNSKIGTQKLLDYADDKRLALRDEAIKGLARAPFELRVLQKLEALALDNQLPANVQRRAVRSVAQIGEKNKDDANVRSQAQQIMRTVSGRAPHLKQEIDEYLKNN